MTFDQANNLDQEGHRRYRSPLSLRELAAMINAHCAQRVRVTTRAMGGGISKHLPLTTGEGNRLLVVVEGSRKAAQQHRASRLGSWRPTSRPAPILIASATTSRR